MIRRFLIALTALVMLFSFGLCDEKNDKLPENFVFFINIGDGDAIVLRLNGKTYMIDTGRKQETVRLYAALNFLKLDKIDGLFITHSHKDHVGGIKALTGKLDVKNSYIASFGFPDKNSRFKTEKILKKNGLNPKRLKAGDKIYLSDDEKDYFEVLAPLYYDEFDDNDNSLVLMLTFKGKRLLFAGDMQFNEEKSLLNAKTPLKADVLKVGNHGNRDATSKAFAEAVSPDISVISTDTLAAPKSASDEALRNLSSSKIYITENAELGYMLNLDEGELQIKDIARPKTEEHKKLKLYIENEKLWLEALLDVEIDKPLLYFKEKGEMVSIGQIKLKAGEKLSIGKNGDIELDTKRYFIKKRIDKLVLFDENGNELASVIKKPMN